MAESSPHPDQKNKKQSLKAAMQKEKFPQQTEYRTGSKG